MFGSIEKTAAAGDHRRATASLSDEIEKHSGLAVPPASSYAPRVSATANLQRKQRCKYTLDFSRL
jgi:hypothetical protein